MTESNESPQPSVIKRIIVLLIWLLLIALTFFACRADERRFKSTVAFQKQEPFTLWQDQVTLISVNLPSPGSVEKVEFLPPTKAFEGYDVPIGSLGSDPSQLGTGKPFELVNNESTLRVYAEINHPKPPSEVELLVWRSDHSGSKYKVIIKRTYYQSLRSFLFDYLKASKETLERDEKRRREMEKIEKR
jgi:hypothetical protein